jgi:hypothetical protein
VARVCSSSHHLLPLLRSHEVIAGILRRTSNSFQRLDNPKDVSIALHLMLSLAQSEPTAEMMAVEGVMMLFVTGSSSLHSLFAHVYLEQGGGRDPWHRAWCLVLSIVTSLLHILGHSERFVDQVCFCVLDGD